MLGVLVTVDDDARSGSPQGEEVGAAFEELAAGSTAILESVARADEGVGSPQPFAAGRAWFVFADCVSILKALLGADEDVGAPQPFVVGCATAVACASTLGVVAGGNEDVGSPQGLADV
jgi:hypothetical protein